MEPVCRAPCLFEFAYIQQLLSARKKMDPPAPAEKQQFRWCDFFFSTLPRDAFPMWAQRMRNRFLFYKIQSFAYAKAEKNTSPEWICWIKGYFPSGPRPGIILPWLLVSLRLAFFRNTTRKCKRGWCGNRAPEFWKPSNFAPSAFLRREKAKFVEWTSRSDIFYRLVGCLHIYSVGRSWWRLFLFILCCHNFATQPHSRHRQKRFISRVFPRQHFVTAGLTTYILLTLFSNPYNNSTTETHKANREIIKIVSSISTAKSSLEISKKTFLDKFKINFEIGQNISVTL